MSLLGVPPKCSLNIDKYLGLQLAIGLPVSFGGSPRLFPPPACSFYIGLQNSRALHEGNAAQMYPSVLRMLLIIR